MATTISRSLQVYAKLATWYERQGQPKLRDWFVVLAADSALALGNEEQSERLRQRLLQWNPHHLLRPFSTFAEAMQSPDVQDYIADLRRNYPLKTAEQLLHSNLGQAPQEERDLKVFRGQTRTAKGNHSTKYPISKIEALPIDDTPPAMSPTVQPAAAPRLDVRPLQPPTHSIHPAPAVAQPVSIPWTEASPSYFQGDEEEPSAFGYWVSTALFVVTLLAAIGLGAIVLLRPLWA
jgi:hypothetical protein